MTGIALPGRLMETSLELPPDMEFDDWLRMGETLRQLEKSVMWWIGDWLNYGERTYGEKYAQAMDATGYSYSTLSNASWAARKIEPSRRRENVEFSKHAAVAGLEIDQQERILDEASSSPMTNKEVNEAAGRERQQRAEEEFGKPARIEVEHCPNCGAPDTAWERRPE